MANSVLGKTPKQIYEMFNGKIRKWGVVCVCVCVLLCVCGCGGFILMCPNHLSDGGVDPRGRRGGSQGEPVVGGQLRFPNNKNDSEFFKKFQACYSVRRMMGETVQLCTMDGEQFEVLRRVAEVSQTLKDLLAESKRERMFFLAVFGSVSVCFPHVSMVC